MSIDEQFLQACKKGDINNAKAAIEAGAEISCKDKFGKDALACACFGGHFHIVEWLISKKVDLYQKTNNGANINNQDSTGITSLSGLVASHNNLELTEFLLGNGADVDIEDQNGWTALMHAANWDMRWNMITQLLIEHGADVNHQSKDGWTPLLLATHDRSVANGSFKILIEDKNIDVNKQGHLYGWTPLMMATGSRYYCDEIIGLLLKRGANVNAVMSIESKKKPKPVHATALAKNLYSDIKIGSGFQGFTALMWAVKQKRAKVAKLLCEASADVNIKSVNGDTAISLAKGKSTKAILNEYA